jgi:hypothetical protein
MKRLLLVLGIVLFLTSCNIEPVNETETNPFVGTWKRVDGGDTRIVFTENVGTLYYPHDVLNWTGSYTYDDNRITVIIDQEKSLPIVMETYGDSFTSAYRFEDGLLLLSSPATTAYRKKTGND